MQAQFLWALLRSHREQCEPASLSRQRSRNCRAFRARSIAISIACLVPAAASGRRASGAFWSRVGGSQPRFSPPPVRSRWPTSQHPSPPAWCHGHRRSRARAVHFRRRLASTSCSQPCSIIFDTAILAAAPGQPLGQRQGDVFRRWAPALRMRSGFRSVWSWRSPIGHWRQGRRRCATSGRCGHQHSR